MSVRGSNGVPSGGLRLALSAALCVGLAACGTTTRLGEDLQVTWTVDGSNAAALCGSLGIDRWVVSVDGPDTGSVDVSCEDELWDSASAFYRLTPGIYDVTLVALDAAGGEVGRDEASVDLRAVTIDLTLLRFDLLAAVDVLWNINGTLDSSGGNESWDFCDEVGAVTAVVTVNGASSSHDCHAGGEMATTLPGLGVGTPRVTVKLQDAGGRDLTSEVPAVSAGGSGSALIADFFFDAFVDTLEGELLFDTTFEGVACTATSPPVDLQITLLSANGVPLQGVEVCNDAGSFCVDANTDTTRSCTGEVQRIRGVAGQPLSWGSYRLKIQGAVRSVPGSPDICWESEVDVLIGAGVENPVIPIDIDRILSTGPCA